MHLKTVFPSVQFLVYEENLPNFFFPLFFVFDSALKTREAHMFFWLVFFFKCTQKNYWLSKTPFWRFLVVNNCFCAFSKILIKITFERLLFLKLKQKENMKKIFSAFVLFCKRKPHANFHKKILLFGHLEFFFKWKIWRTCVAWRAACACRKFGFVLLKPYRPLVSWPVMTIQKKKFHTPP